MPRSEQHARAGRASGIARATKGKTMLHLLHERALHRLSLIRLSMSQVDALNEAVAELRALRHERRPARMAKIDQANKYLSGYERGLIARYLKSLGLPSEPTIDDDTGEVEDVTGGEYADTSNPLLHGLSHEELRALAAEKLALLELAGELDEDEEDA